ncbi:MAG TPA: FAD-dependent oxidoreductase, partial [Nitrolancea sp.]|nr:FAD-dependent oxidoreductase [Nitrolancea sp.]
QDMLDPVLLAAARRGGANIRFNCEVDGIEPDASGVKISLSENGGRSTLCARYVIAADGSGSFIRRRLGIATIGPGELGAYIINVLFEADLSALVGDHPFVIAEVKNEQMHGMFIRVRDNHRWVLHISYDPAKGESADDFTPERCRELIHVAIGRSDIAIEILGILPWQVAGSVAEHFRQGQVFLIGDAAHVVPPTGGFGLNTGIGDAHNLAWKLALVLQSQADAALLDTYDAERRPVAHFTLDQSLLRLQNAELHFDPTRVSERIERGIANPLVVDLGYRYASPAIIEPQPLLPSLEDLGQDLDGSPGTRLPHVWVEHDAKRISTLDLIGSRFTVLAGQRGESWCLAAETIATHRSLDLAAYRIDEDIIDPYGALSSAFGIYDTGALLVRPDGFIAWRALGQDAQPEQVMQRVFERLLGGSLR